MPTKREAPYTRLKRIASEFARAVQSPHKRAMFRYPALQLTNGWNLSPIAERASAAAQLGYRVEVEVVNGDLLFNYVLKNPPTPWELR